MCACFILLFLFLFFFFFLAKSGFCTEIKTSAQDYPIFKINLREGERERERKDWREGGREGEKELGRGGANTEASIILLKACLQMTEPLPS